MNLIHTTSKMDKKHGLIISLDHLTSAVQNKETNTTSVWLAGEADKIELSINFDEFCELLKDHIKNKPPLVNENSNEALDDGAAKELHDKLSAAILNFYLENTESGGVLMNKRTLGKLKYALEKLGYGNTSGYVFGFKVFESEQIQDDDFIGFPLPSF